MSPVFVRIFPYIIPQYTEQSLHVVLYNKTTEHKICFEFLYKFVYNIKVISRNQEDLIINVDMSTFKTIDTTVIFS
jgi:hypothetical protein